MLITRSNEIESDSRKHTTGREIKIGPLTLQFITILFVAILALFYLAQSTQSATRNYKMRELEEQKRTMETENKRLEVDVIRLKSLNEIKNGVQSQKMEPAKEAGYIAPGTKQSARR